MFHALEHRLTPKEEGLDGTAEPGVVGSGDQPRCPVGE